ncbi:hypothetical protein [Halogeometricum limi]|uniref:Uncharacterized protein n=1 Tax=Halogeometricum limi TaxID=555875 RepID=A0A1I6FRP9_9EURY|nr:hypothetical protein [Halogeometricum limi]SFR32584.1 hypothetical protein SAMN04488124_0148 [Halogeometricum limi]
MSHQRESQKPQGAPVPRPSVDESGVLARLRRHVRTWPKRYVEMRTGRFDPDTE